MTPSKDLRQRIDDLLHGLGDLCQQAFGSRGDALDQGDIPFIRRCFASMAQEFGLEEYATRTIGGYSEILYKNALVATRFSVDGPGVGCRVEFIRLNEQGTPLDSVIRDPGLDSDTLPFTRIDFEYLLKLRAPDATQRLHSLADNQWAPNYGQIVSTTLELLRKHASDLLSGAPGADAVFNDPALKTIVREGAARRLAHR